MSKRITNGIIVSPGIIIGKAYVYKGNKLLIPKYRIAETEIQSELERFEAALEKTKIEIKEIQKQIASHLSNDMADIFTSHLMVLEDPLIEVKARKTLAEEKRNIEWIINDISLELMDSLGGIEDDYLRERIIDISDINKRLISNLLESSTSTLSNFNEDVIIFAPDLTPSETALMNKERVLAFVTDHGGKTSHTSIMARALEIPAIVGTSNGTSQVTNGDTVIVDAIHGHVIINPKENEIKEFLEYQKDYYDLEEELSKIKHLPAQTTNNEEIFILGNIEIPEEKDIIKDHGVQGIGLFRSEFLFIDKSLPDEERQFEEYKTVIEYFAPLPVTIRTIDVGGDKIHAINKPYKERNPFLGCRAIRFSLEHIDLFRTQLRAILRASHYGNAKLMFPMITTVEEFIKAKTITHEMMDELRKEGIPFNENIEIGLMIEVPSAVINADILAKHADFFSIGTNDLVQYLLAVDRISEKIAYLYNPLNLAVLRFLKQIVSIAQINNVPISICGEIAGEPQYTMILLGLGFRHLSMSSSYMYHIKKIVRSVSINECEELANQLLQLENTDDIEALVRLKVKDKFHQIFI